MAQVMTTEKGRPIKDLPLKEGEIRPNDTVVVYMTDKSKYHQPGKEVEVHTMLAEKLIASGKAVRELPKAATGKKEDKA